MAGQIADCDGTQGWQETSVDPDAFFTASAPAHNAPDSHSSLSLSPPSTAAAPPSGSMGLVQALVAPGSAAAAASSNISGADGGARTGGVGIHDGLGADMLHDVLSDKPLDHKDRHSHAHTEVSCDQEAAQQSPASCTSKLVAYYTTCDKPEMQDAMDVLAETPSSPSEAHKSGVDESKPVPPSPARSTGSMGKLNACVLDVEEVCSVSLLTGGRSPALQSMDRTCATLAHEIDKLDSNSESLESDPNVRPASLDPMLSALI
jgi:hypothetical protein